MTYVVGYRSVRPQSYQRLSLQIDIRHSCAPAGVTWRLQTWRTACAGGSQWRDSRGLDLISIWGFSTPGPSLPLHTHLRTEVAATAPQLIKNVAVFLPVLVVVCSLACWLPLHINANTDFTGLRVYLCTTACLCDGFCYC